MTEETNIGHKQLYTAAIIYVIVLAGWIIFFALVIEPTIEVYQLENISNLIGSLLNALGILIGFAGLSAYYSFGKISELSSKISSEAINAVSFHSNSKLEIDRMFLRITRFETKALAEKCSDKIINAIQKGKSDAEELIKAVNELKETAIRQKCRCSENA